MPDSRRDWPDRYLVGNGSRCSACGGEGVIRGRFNDPIARCRPCNGTGRDPYGEARVYDTTTKERAKEASIYPTGESTPRRTLRSTTRCRTPSGRERLTTHSSGKPDHPLTSRPIRGGARLETTEEGEVTMPSPQKIHAVMRKAGLRRAVYHKSKQVRGWGSWTEGYIVEKAPAGDADAIHVQHRFPSTGHGGDLHRYLDAYRAALTEAGYDVAETMWRERPALTIYYRRTAV